MKIAGVSVLPNQQLRAFFHRRLHAFLAHHPPGMKTRRLQEKHPENAKPIFIVVKTRCDPLDPADGKILSWFRCPLNSSRHRQISLIGTAKARRSKLGPVSLTVEYMIVFLTGVFSKTVLAGSSLSNRA